VQQIVVRIRVPSGVVQHGGLAVNAPLRFGNAGRNILEGPAFRNFDFALLKDTRIAEARNIESRAEFFNVFNHPNFALPGNILTAPNFAPSSRRLTSLRTMWAWAPVDSRLIQFALKLSF
jgi:hypothetical protein